MVRPELATRRLDAQYALSRVISTATTLDDAAGRILEIVGASLGCVFAELWVVERDHWTLQRFASWSAPDVDGGAFLAVCADRRFQRGEGLPGTVAEAGAPRWVRDVCADPDFRRREEAARLGIKTAIAFPVRFAGDTTGVIQFFDRHEREPDDELLDVFADVGSQVGLFLERVVMGQLVKRQQLELIQLSTPVLQVAPGVLLAPIVGSLDAARAAAANERIVETVVATSARVVIVDVTGVPHLDTAVTEFLMGTLRAARLVGAEVVLTGVRAALAQTLVRIGVRLDEVTSAVTLAEGLRLALVAARARGR